jgi:hypothetical protein
VAVKDLPKLDTKKPDAPAKFVMPRPTALVLWRHVIGGTPSPAAVTQVGRDAISVMIFPPDSRAGVPKDAVMHISDPRARTLVSPESGLWDYPPEYSAILDRLSVLEAADK